MKKYENPRMDVMHFDSMDIITTSVDDIISGGGLGGGDAGDGGGTDVNGRSRTSF